MSKFKPLLATEVTNFEALKFPLSVTPKLDGIRCIISLEGVALSRSLKPIPNKYVQKVIHDIWMKDPSLFSWLDGELMIDGLDYNAIQSAIMSFEGEPPFRFYVFDRVDIATDSWIARWQRFIEDFELHTYINFACMKHITPLRPTHLRDLGQLFEYEQKMVDAGYEGVMIRSLEGHYKYGRSTEREGILLKMKRFYDAEATVIGVKEKMHNANPQERDERGYAKRSSKKENLVPADTLGALVCQMKVRTSADIEAFEPNSPTAVSITFSDPMVVHVDIGTGFTDAQRAELWADKENLNGKIVKFKFQEYSKDSVPRFPVFQGFRNINDMGE